jgi:hypothetical protein
MENLCLVTELVLSLAEVNSGCVVSIDEDLLESEAKEIIGGLLDVLPVLSDELAGGEEHHEICGGRSSLGASGEASPKRRNAVVKPPYSKRI